MTFPKITIVNEANFEQEVLKADKLVLIDFYADWCGPCRALAPTLDQIAEENPNVKIVKINIDENEALAAAFNVKSIPLLVTMQDGQGLFGLLGLQPRKAIDQLIEQSLNPPSLPPKPQGPSI